MRAVCKIRQQKTETCRTRLTAGVNLIYYPEEASTPKLYLTTMKLHVNSAIYDIKSRYMCMDVKYLYLNIQMDRVEYIIYIYPLSHKNLWKKSSRTKDTMDISP